MKKHCLLLAIACLFGLQAIYAQNALRLSPYDPAQIPASISIGDTFSFDVWVHNDSASVFSDTVDFTFEIIHGDTFTQTQPNNTIGFNWQRNTITFIPAVDSVLMTIFVNVTPPAFKAGPSVVIIWPRALGVQGTGYNQNYGAILSINDVADNRMRFAIEQNTLNITRLPEIELNQLKLYDITGKLLYEKANPGERTPLPLYSHGTYLVEVTYNTHQRRIFRFNY